MLLQRPKAGAAAEPQVRAQETYWRLQAQDEGLVLVILIFLLKCPYNLGGRWLEAERLIS